MLSIAIIGKNEAQYLASLFDSLGSITLTKEIIYVDSASTDESVKIAKKHANKVIVLKDSPQLCAAAGRYIASQQAKFDWILYLDGDMILEEDFIAFLNSKKFQTYSDKIAGFVGYYEYLYKDGSSDTNRLLQAPETIVNHFGGAVMLKKEIVLKAGNWNPSVVANEEIDLYMKIKNLGAVVYGLDRNFVKHHAKKVSNLDMLQTLFFPKNRYFYGYGQVLVSQFLHKTLHNFILHKPYPFLYLLFFILLPFSLWALVALVILFLFVSFTKKWHYNILYISDIIKGFIGIFTYKSFEPSIIKVYHS